MKTCNSNLVDTHAHLDFEHFDDDRENVIKTCKEKLKAVINSGAGYEGNKRTLKLSKEYNDFIFSCLGLHPTHDQEDVNKVYKQIEDEEDKILGVGEIGLDYYHHKEKEKRGEQEERFREMLELAERIEKPVVIHSRDAEKKALQVLSEFDPKTVVMHCFNGGLSRAKEAIERGYFISISTQVLYSNRVKLLARQLPLKNLLLETDSPFLGKGKRNVPWRIEKSLKIISELREEDEDELEAQFYENTLKAFPDLRGRIE